MTATRDGGYDKGRLLELDSNQLQEALKKRLVLSCKHECPDVWTHEARRRRGFVTNRW